MWHYLFSERIMTLKRINQTFNLYLSELSKGLACYMLPEKCDMQIDQGVLERPLTPI